VTEPMTAEEFVDHLQNCGPKADAFIVMENGLSGDDVVATLLAEGWTWGGVEYVGGKRIRNLIAPTQASA
jgi:hypothetical protein